MSGLLRVPEFADEVGGGTVVSQLRFGLAGELADDLLRKHLAEFDAPLIEGIDVPDSALSEDGVLYGSVSKLERTRRSGCEDRRAANARLQIEKKVMSQEKAIPSP